MRLKPFPPAASIEGLWASVAFVLDMDKGELYMQARHSALLCMISALAVPVYAGGG